MDRIVQNKPPGLFVKRFSLALTNAARCYLKHDAEIIRKNWWQWTAVTRVRFSRASEGRKHRYVQGTLQLHFLGRRPCCYFGKLYWRLLDYAKKPQRPLLGFCFTSQATDSKSVLPPASSWFYKIMVFCLFVRPTLGTFKLLPQHGWKIPYNFYCEQTVVDFSYHGSSLRGPQIFCKLVKLSQN